MRTVESLGLDGPVDRWRRVRDAIHGEVCSHGFDPRRGTFVRAYDTEALDASLLVLPIVGFLLADDRRCFALRSDVGLLSEEYGVQSRRFLGNFPQALSHTSLIRSAMTLSGYGDDLAGRPHSGRLPNRRGLRGYPDDI